MVSYFDIIENKNHLIFFSLTEYLAWIIGWDLVLEYLLAAATVAVGWSGYVVDLVEIISKHNTTSWIVQAPVAWNETSSTFFTTKDVINLPAVVLVIALTLLLLIGVGESAMINLIIVIIKLIVILVFIFASCAYVKRSNYTPFFPPNEGKNTH